MSEVSFLFGADRVQMDITDEGDEVGVFIAEDGFVPVFEEVTGADVFAVEVLRIPGKEFSHDGRYAVFAAFEQHMNMVVHEHPCVNRACSFFDVQTESFEEAGFVFVVPEDIRLVEPSHHDRVKSTGDI